jgi:hypothetical protein
LMARRKAQDRLMDEFRKPRHSSFSIYPFCSSIKRCK